MLLSYVNKGDYLFSFNLKSGYHRFDIFPDHQTFWDFSWVFPGSVRYFCFSVLPLGPSSAPYVFTKCLRPLVKFWRFNGVKIAVFLDDGCGKGDSLQIAKRHSFVCPVVCSQFYQIAMEPYSVSCLVRSLVGPCFGFNFY